MLGVNRELVDLENSGKEILVGLVGAGQMGRGMISQIESMKGMRVAATSDINIENVKYAYDIAGVKVNEVKEAENINEANKVIKDGNYLALTKTDLLCEVSGIDVIVDATGVPEVGASVALKAIENNKHIVMLNVEADITVGVYLHKIAKEKGVVYTGSAGDEPGAIMELYDFADALGFKIIGAGKGKNNPLNFDANPESVAEAAAKKKSNPKMIASFQDGTKTMVEMNAVANATGFLPDKPGMHGFEASVKELPEIFQLKSEGGKIKNHRIVDFVNGIAPGVFLIISSDKEEVNEEMKYLSMGEGPNYVLYRPYHLTSLETPLSIAKAYLHKTSTIAPYVGMIAETATVAKIDLKAGQCLDTIGGFTVYGRIYEYKEAKSLNVLPIGLVNNKLVLKNDVKKGDVITYDDVDYDGNSLIWELRKKQDRMLND